MSLTASEINDVVEDLFRHSMDEDLRLLDFAREVERRVLSTRVGLPPVRQEVAWFAVAMEKKLTENDHKTHWRKSGLPYLVGRLHQEAYELMVALQRKNDPDGVLDEAADVANFAMMIADLYVHQRRGVKKEK